MTQSDLTLEFQVDEDFRSVLEDRGIGMSPQGLVDLVFELVSGLPKASDDSELSESDREQLQRVGMSFEPFEGDFDPLAGSVVKLSQLIASSLTTTEVAEKLGVGPSRVRQRLSSDAPTLYGFKFAREWKLPQFQFSNGGLVPGMEEVIPNIPERWSPLEVFNWFSSPNPDLVVSDNEEKPLSPIEWLESGRDPSELSVILERI